MSMCSHCLCCSEFRAGERAVSLCLSVSSQTVHPHHLRVIACGWQAGASWGGRSFCCFSHPEFKAVSWGGGGEWRLSCGFKGRSLQGELPTGPGGRTGGEAGCPASPVSTAESTPPGPLSLRRLATSMGDAGLLPAGARCAVLASQVCFPLVSVAPPLLLLVAGRTCSGPSPGSRSRGAQPRREAGSRHRLLWGCGC